MIKVFIGNHEFDTKKDAKAYFTEILNRTELNSKLSGDDFNDIKELLETHPNSSEKIGVGIAELYVANTSYQGKCFHLKRIDGSSDNFGIHKCIDGESDKKNFNMAARQAIKDDMIQLRRDLLQQNNIQETEYQNYHVHHQGAKSFSVIVNMFITMRQIQLSSINYNTIEIYGKEFQDETLKNDFRDFHNNEAMFRLITKQENLRNSHLARITITSRDTVIR
jgi:hypothetical protein